MKEPKFEDDKFIVINKKNLTKLSDSTKRDFEIICDVLHSNNRYIVCNQDEPYAEEVKNIILGHEKEKFHMFKCKLNDIIKEAKNKSISIDDLINIINEIYE